MMPGTWNDQYDEDESSFVNNAEDCPICYGEMQLGLKTNCGHVYCGECILAWVHRRSNGRSAMSCPYCTQKVTTLVPCFNEVERNNQEWAEIETRILEEAGQYNNRRFSEEPAEIENWARILEDVEHNNERVFPILFRFLHIFPILHRVPFFFRILHIVLFIIPIIYRLVIFSVPRVLYIKLFRFSLDLLLPKPDTFVEIILSVFPHFLPYLTLPFFLPTSTESFLIINIIIMVLKAL